MTSHARLLRAVFVAFVIAAGVVTIKLIAEDVCNNPLACFEPGQEAEMWQALTPFGETNEQAHYDLSNNLISGCTNSVHPPPIDGRVRYAPRQCVRDGYALLMPPPLGQMLDPFAVAADGERIYVSDQSNHRVQVFKFDGTPIPIAHPIGDGIPGAGPYPAYPADSSLTGHNDPITGQRLESPDGIAADAAHTLIVGDYSGYVMAFSPDGSPAFGTMENPGRLQLQAPNGIETKASGIAISPGTIVRGFGVPIQPQDTGRIVVTDRLNCFVYIYDAGFNLVRRIPDAIPPDAYQGACVFDEDGNSTFGVFDTPVAAAFDAHGRTYISEYGNNRIQILDPNGDSLGGFGSDQLQYPWGVFVDQHGRVVVADTENQRIAFFDVDLSGPPDATLLFELDAKGTLDGFPTAIVEQVGNANGLDPAGRILVTDTLNNRIQRFQLPDLAIINTRIDLVAQTGTFQVVVPPGKVAAVNNVGVSAVGVNANVLTLNGIAPANSTPLDVTKPATENATDLLGTDIQPSQIATYQFAYSAAADARISFIFNAVGNDGATAADPHVANLELPCVTCVSTHTILKKPALVVATPLNGWYNTALTVRLSASTIRPDGLEAIAYQFLSGPESSGLRHGGAIHTVAAHGAQLLSTDVDVLSEGISSFRYWAIGGDGSVEASHFVSLSLDMTPPYVSFHFLAQPNAAGWFNASQLPVQAAFVHLDDRSGPEFTDTGSVSFAHAGRNQYVEESATDRAGNTRLDAQGNPWPFRSDVQANGGFPVNIDTNAPTLQSIPNDVVIEASGPHYGVLPPGTFNATATDPNLIDDPRPGADLTGSGVVAINNPAIGHQFPMGETTWPFSATDAAGNVSSAVTRKVTVIKKPSAITAAPISIVYGTPLTMSATISPSWATGSLTFVLDNGTPSNAPIVAGGASLAMPLLAVGTHTLVISYPGSASVANSNRSVTITVRSLNNLPPDCSAAKGGEIWPPNHTKFYAAPITDVVDPEGGPLTIVVTAISQDEPVDSTGDGKFSPDGQGIGTATAWLRAERNGVGNKAAGDGRVYEIAFTATDDAGEQCQASVLWTVPHDQGQRAKAIDSVVRYDSTLAVAGAKDKKK